MQKAYRKFTFLSIFLFAIFWIYRIIKITSAIHIGTIPDWDMYYFPARTIISGHPDINLIIRSTFGPPFVILPYLPFAFFPYKFSQYLITFINLGAYFTVFYLLWKRYVGARSWLFFLLISSLAFSFPLIFSLGMGNPLGLVTLGIYIFWITKNTIAGTIYYTISVLLKIFPISILPSILLSKNKKYVNFNFCLLNSLLIAVILCGVISALVLPYDIWEQYIAKVFILNGQFKIADAVIYNQSFSSTLTRLGFSVSSFSPIYWLFTVLLLIILIADWISYFINKNKFDTLDLGVLSVCFILLIHPAPWQLYFSVLLPYLIIKLGNLNFRYLPVFLLISLNGAWFNATGLLGGFINSSQFFGTLLLFIIITSGYLSIRRKYLSEKRILLIIIVSGFLLRLSGLLNIKLEGDFFRYWQVAGNIINDHYLPLLGPSASVNTNFSIGPFFYYLISIPYFLGKGDYKIAVVFFSLLNSISIYILYKTLSEWFMKNVSLKITAFYALSYYMIFIGNFPWNPYFVPFLTITELFILTRIIRGKVKYLPILFFLFGLALQTHATTLFLIPVIILFLPFKKIRYVQWIMAFSTFILPLLPWLIANFQCHNCQLNEAIKIFSGNPQQCSLAIWLQYHGNGERCFNYIRNSLFVFRMFSESIFGTSAIAGAVIFFVLIIIFFLIFRNKIAFFLKSWIIAVISLFIFYSSNIYLHYFLILIPLPFVITVLLLEKIKQKQRGKTIADAAFYILIGFNIVEYLLSLSVGRG